MRKKRVLRSQAEKLVQIFILWGITLLKSKSEAPMRKKRVLRSPAEKLVQIFILLEITLLKSKSEAPMRKKEFCGHKLKSLFTDLCCCESLC